MLSFEGLLRVPDTNFLPMQRVGPLAKLPRLVEELGFDPKLLFDERSIVASEISDQGNPIAAHARINLSAMQS